MKELSIVLVLLLVPSVAFGQGPTVTGHSGILSAGGTITVTGSDFGVKDPVPPVLFDDFESHADGFVYGTGWNYDESSVPAPWDSWWYSGDATSDIYRPVLTVIDSLQAEGRGKCLEIRHPSPRNVAYMVKNFPRTGMVYLDLDMKKATYGNAQELANSKTWKICQGGDITRSIFFAQQCGGSHGDIRPSVPGTLLDLTPWDVNMREPNTFTEGRFREWTGWQVVYRESSAMRTLDAYAKNYWNCEVAGEGLFYDKPTDTAPYWFDSLIIGGQEASSGYGDCFASPDAGIYSFYDHIYLDTTWQRIEIGDAPVYDDCTERTIQIPTSWIGDSISFTVRTDQFADGQDAWVFVVDENNVPSAGYPLVVNASTDQPGVPGKPSRR